MWVWYYSTELKIPGVAILKITVVKHQSKSSSQVEVSWTRSWPCFPSVTKFYQRKCTLDLKFGTLDLTHNQFGTLGIANIHVTTVRVVPNLPKIGHLPSQRPLNTRPKIVINQSQDGHPSSRGRSPTITRMFTHHPKDVHQPFKGHSPKNSPKDIHPKIHYPQAGHPQKGHQPSTGWSPTICRIVTHQTYDCQPQLPWWSPSIP